MTILSFLSLNNQEITEQGRKISSAVNFGASEVSLDSGISRRYIKTNKRQFTFTWDWLPSLSSQTIDQRKSRDYLKELAFSFKNKMPMKIKLDHEDDAEIFDVYINEYSEDLLRRDIQSGCDYYSVSLTVEEA
jgi:hypothetical protein